MQVGAVLTATSKQIVGVREDEFLFDDVSEGAGEVEVGHLRNS